jgi:Amt family ammonium transporter
MAAIVIGVLGALASFAALRLLKRTGLDDTLDVFACHGVGGIVGSLLTGVFATTAVNSSGADGLLYGNPKLLLVQVVGVALAAGWAAVGTVFILVVVRKLVGIRASSEAEQIGIDIAEHAEHAYVHDTLIGSKGERLRPLSGPVTVGF